MPSKCGIREHYPLDNHPSQAVSHKYDWSQCSCFIILAIIGKPDEEVISVLPNAKIARGALERCIVLKRPDADIGDMRRKHVPRPDRVFYRWGIRRGLPCAEIVPAQAGYEDDAVFLLVSLLCFHRNH